MSRSSEDILLTVHHVKHKKNDGILFIMSERIGWMIGNRDVFSLHHKYTDIKSQKISPEGKPKVQLQIVLHDGSNTTFHFVNPAGRQEQISDRDGAKELLLQLLPKFKKKVNKELEDKNRKLSESPNLLQLYKDLVSTHILTADEFWARHGKSGLGLSSNTGGENQEVGVSGSFLGEIKPQADGANGLKYNLTGDIIQSIFKTYPAVKKKHTEKVPQIISEQEFWTKFFQSHYFHRDRIIGKGVKDLFTECAKDDDKKIKAALTTGVSDILADIAKFDDTSLDQHYGSKDSEKSQVNFVHQNIIKRFNHHSIMVMNVSKNPSEVNSNVNKRLKEKLEYEDLNTKEPYIKIAKLSLTKPERYLNGPTPVLSSSYCTSDELSRSRKLLADSLRTWKNTRPPNVLTASKAVSTLTDLTPGGALMKGSQSQALAESCPETVQQDLKQVYISLGELLRHFWACYPPTTPQLQEKASKMFETLKKFERVKIRPFENELIRNYNSAAKMTTHINRMLDAAYRKHTTWQQKVK
ncbi:general transcription factor IIH subunit 1 [Lepeophtheirus salmonis]|uniref:BSD domain-containing protein n=1 Tax=Lepeophtheirus salmonis TaxID=72036 RepID=A0A0K2U2E3_LEPSM|nr:general transcription factor IIH subunit 1-like [Lepeophtheirus salmonis]